MIRKIKLYHFVSKLRASYKNEWRHCRKTQKWCHGRNITKTSDVMDGITYIVTSLVKQHTNECGYGLNIEKKHEWRHERDNIKVNRSAQILRKTRDNRKNRKNYRWQERQKWSQKTIWPWNKRSGVITHLWKGKSWTKHFFLKVIIIIHTYKSMTKWS